VNWDELVARLASIANGGHPHLTNQTYYYLIAALAHGAENDKDKTKICEMEGSARQDVKPPKRMKI